MEQSFKIAVKGLLIRNGKALIIKRSNYDGTGFGWELPGGGVQFGEGMEEALMRECREEIGLRVAVGSILYADAFFPTDCIQVVILTYLCTSEAVEITLSHEHIDYRWVTSEEARTLLMPGINTAFEKYGVYNLIEWNKK